MSKKDDEIIKIFAALGDKSRLKIISLIKGNPKANITSIAAKLPFTRQGLSKHLGVLTNAGIVKTKRSGREVSLHIDNKSYAKAQKYLSILSGGVDNVTEETQTIAAPIEVPITEVKPVIETPKKPTKPQKPAKPPASMELDQLSLF